MPEAIPEKFTVTLTIGVEPGTMKNINEIADDARTELFGAAQQLGFAEGPLRYTVTYVSVR